MNASHDQAVRPASWTGHRVGCCLFAATCCHAAAALAALVLVHVVGERWWAVTLLLFCPRWVYLVPAAALGLATCLAGRASLLPTQAAVALIVAGPLMGFTVPWDRSWRPTPAGQRVRVLAFNQHNGSYRVADLIRLIERTGPDVLCFQELTANPTLEAYLARGWFRDPSRSIASRFPIVRAFDTASSPYGEPPLSRVIVRTPAGDEFVVVSVHRPSMRRGFRSFRRGDVRGLARVVDGRRRAMSDLASGLNEVGGLPTVVAGDFNTTADSSLFDPIRERFSFGSEEAGWGYSYTWPARLPGIKIDHVLASPEWVFTGFRVGPDLGSDHRPVIAEVVRTPAPGARPR